MNGTDKDRLPYLMRMGGDISALIGPSNVLALGERKGLLAQRNGDGTIRIYTALTVPRIGR